MTLYQFLRAEPGRRLALGDVHREDAARAVEEAARDGWYIWISYSGGYIEAICELELKRRESVGTASEAKCGPL